MDCCEYHQRILFYGVLLCLGLSIAPAVHARKGNEPVYFDPFDLGAGGASLTRASKEGRIYANPALMTYGGKFHRWIGLTETLLSTQNTLSTARDLIPGQSSNQSSEPEENNTQEFVDTLFKNPVRVGWGLAASYVSANFGLGMFSRYEPDFQAREFGRYGLPEVVFSSESYHGSALAVAAQAPWRWLSFGITAKYIYALEPHLVAEITDEATMRDLQNQTLIPDLQKHYRGLGIDAGMVLFFQGTHLDWSLAGKIDDAGGLAFTPGSSPAAENSIPENFRQVVSAGGGVTLHTGADAVHLALDYRDILSAYGDESFKKIYAGAKILIRTYLGLAAGLYHGNPSYGAEIDLILLRIALTSYKRELGDRPGVNPRQIIMGTVSTGF